MSVASVREHLARFEAAERMRFLPGSIATVDLAAMGLGVESGRIAKTLAVKVKGQGRVVAIVVKGTARLDNGKFKNVFGGKSSFVQHDECLEITGHPPGGVCPFGLREGVEVFLDVTLKDYPSVYPAAGAPDNCLETSIDELEAWTGGTWVDVCR